jgi:hypothetical protein
MPQVDLETINSTLKQLNPFARPPQVTANDVWEHTLLDIESLNSHASNAVFQVLSHVQQRHYSANSILITADIGTGKSHIISRIRHRLQAEGSGLFILANRFNDLNKPHESFQELLSESLNYIGSRGVKQWQDLASSMVNDINRTGKPGAQKIPAENLISLFSKKSFKDLQTIIEQLTTKFCRIKQIQDPDIVKAIFWTLSDQQCLFAVKWLGGKELAQYKANEIRLPTQNQSFNAVLQILDLISSYNELVICFDELDNNDFNDAGFHRAEVTAGLIKDLFQNLKRGVILTVMLSTTWTKRVKQNSPESVRGKLTAYGEPIALQPLNSDLSVEVVQFFLQRYYQNYDIQPPDPLYPFEEDKIRKIGHNKPTMRELLLWCRNYVDGNVIDPIEEAFSTELQAVTESDLEKSDLLGKALFYNFSNLVGQTIEGVTITAIIDRVTKASKKDPYLNFKIVGEEGGKSVCVGVAVLQHDGGNALGAGFKRLLDYDQFGLSRGCLVRSESKSMTQYLQNKYLKPLIAKGGEYVDLKFEEVRPLLALYSISQKLGLDYTFSEQDFQKFVLDQATDKKFAADNLLIKEILSDPSYQAPVLQDEPEVEASNQVTANDLDLNDDSIELLNLGVSFGDND